ncbi:plasmid replication protein RepH [Halorubrum ezzemoulense]|uniref:plasmid replication protein RepH n=1 Tax=Halorubrum ezzemoulense TaxID=337243 RepID=UPI002330DAA2|nr:plasmid replication protein RepH [Halorubrum ezzemoulense]MDB9250840.1 plasmid replication protein RepH [Halorubrum ezzemoulense]MDB9261011.1 plasmid replication protein RepH [Halorubrum ezzemoulense]MDB9264396.1 plasmid replication protein RepH [Halorubrum ezzemoulense]MDB9267888.1 plasmid replication protein RepH [Halorubrum ezzemoulense]MDB9271372.1 plasmid replication protein RepH [Halorubrum ezzemoulense]
MRTRQPAAPERGVHLASNKPAESTDRLVCSGVTPRRTEWLPELLSELRPRTEATIRNYSRTDSWRTSTALCSRLHPDWNTLDDAWTDDVAEAVAYTHAITTLATTYDTTEERSRYHQHRHADLVDTVESIGTGRGPVNAGLGALAKGPVALHRELDREPRVITLLLDGAAWTSLEDRRTGVRALATIAVLAHGFCVRVGVSPALQRHLMTRYPQWTEAHLDLTVSRDRSPTTGHHQPRRVDDAWAAICDLDTEPTKRHLLGCLTDEDARSYTDLTNEPTLDIAEGTISRYVLDLEARDLVTVDRRGQQNTVQLTELGTTAVTACLDDTEALIHPDQCQLDGRLTGTPQRFTSTVSPRRAGGPTTEEWITATGKTDDDAEYVQWLTDPNANSPIRHQRFATVAVDDSITLVDDPLDAFEDGRVAYLSHTDTETLVICQWGGPLATLGRLASALLSENALNHILTPARLGQQFENITDSSEDTPRIIQRGHQVGWFSEDEATYQAWRDRITTVRDQLLARLAELTNSDDTAARSDLFADLHGLVASVTQLYQAAGLDLTTTLRVPDTAALARNHKTRADFCAFLAKTVPKQSVFGIHSGYRLLFEDRPAKLRRRLPYDVDPTDRLDLTMSWVIAGPTITELHEAITTTLEQELATVREAIAEGTEDAPPLSIPVRDATTYPAIRRVIDEIAMTHDVQWTPRERQQLVRLCLRSFGPADTTRRACPYDVVESLQQARNEPHHPTPADVERAAATLPPERFRPDLAPTATKLYATLLRADKPLGRSELLERADISASSYDRRLRDVRALDRVCAVQVDGHRRWTTRATRVQQSAATLETHQQPPTPDQVVTSHATGQMPTHSACAESKPVTTTHSMIRNSTHHCRRRHPLGDHLDRQPLDHPQPTTMRSDHPTEQASLPLHSNQRGERQ